MRKLAILFVYVCVVCAVLFLKAQMVETPSPQPLLKTGGEYTGRLYCHNGVTKVLKVFKWEKKTDDAYFESLKNLIETTSKSKVEAALVFASFRGAYDIGRAVYGPLYKQTEEGLRGSGISMAELDAFKVSCMAEQKAYEAKYIDNQ